VFVPVARDGRAPPCGVIIAANRFRPILEKAAFDDALIKPGRLARTISTKFFSSLKNPDSRSERHPFGRPSPIAMSARAHRSCEARMQEVPAEKVFAAKVIS
jgi:hypothetical protein